MADVKQEIADKFYPIKNGNASKERNRLLSALTEYEERVRTVVAEYIRTEGCSCCQNIKAHDAAKKILAELLDVQPYSDGSGFDFGMFEGSLGGKG